MQPIRQMERESTWPIAHLTSFQPTWLINNLMRPPFALAQMAKPQRRVWLACSTVGPLAGSAARTGCLLRLQADLVLDRVPTVMKKFGLYLRLNRWRLCIAFSTC